MKSLKSILYSLSMFIFVMKNKYIDFLNDLIYFTTNKFGENYERTRPNPQTFNQKPLF